MSEANGTNGWRPKKDWIGELDTKIPRSKEGDPAFTWLGFEGTTIGVELEKNETLVCQPIGVLSVFTPEQVVYLVNKQLYALEYQREHHRKRSQEERDVLGPIRRKAKEMFGLSSYLMATEEQLEAAVLALKKEKQTS